MASLCWADRGIIVLSEYRLYLEGHYCRVESGSRKRTGRSFNDKAAKVSQLFNVRISIIQDLLPI